MSLAALLLIAAALAGWLPVPPVGNDAPHDEGTPARLFQLLMLLQVPSCAVFAGKWLPRAPRPALLVLLLQVSVAALTIATIVWLER
jgi:hypothetical protein